MGLREENGEVRPKRKPSPHPQASSERGVDWSELPSDLISKIAGTLDEIADRIRFAAVCKHWRSTAANLPPVRGHPWLLLPKRADMIDNDSEEGFVQTFFSPSNKETYNIHVADTRCKRIFAVSSGWILTGGTPRTTMLLSNPITKARFSLPQLPFDPTDASNFCQFKIVVSPESLYVMISRRYQSIMCYRLELKTTAAAAWAQSKICCGSDMNYIRVFTYFQGRYIVLKDANKQRVATFVIDADGTRKVVESSPLSWIDSNFFVRGMYFVRAEFLVESSSGKELFRVITPARDITKRYEVFRLDGTGWSNVSSIGHDIFFFSAGNATALEASSLNGYRENCIVFLDYGNIDFPFAWTWSDHITRMCLFDVGSGVAEEIPSCLHKNLMGARAQGWFVPSP